MRTMPIRSPMKGSRTAAATVAAMYALRKSSRMASGRAAAALLQCARLLSNASNTG